MYVFSEEDNFVHYTPLVQSGTGGVCFLGEDKQIVYTDIDNHHVIKISLNGAKLQVIGSGQPLSLDGCMRSASFIQPSGICTEGKSIYVTDAASGKVISTLRGTIRFLCNLKSI